MGRISNASKNIKYGYFGSMLTLVLKFVSRSVFISTIGVTYLGVNGLYTNILSVLSFAELGIGTAMNFSLYKPVADGDKEKIKSLMYLYKHAYRWIALIITVIGLLIVPFLNFIIKDPGVISSSDLLIYYLIFLFNTVSTYFISYKYSLVNADQKNYIQTNVQTITSVVITLFQVVILFVFKSFLFYLLIAALLELLQKLIANRYLNSRYPYLMSKDVVKLSKEEIAPIKRNIRALVFHKIGDISAMQTDNILISAFINISTVGIVSNYILIITSVSRFIDIIFNSIISGFGNLIATENVNRQYALFKVYRFAGFWFYGFASIAFVILINPFIELWIGPQMLLNDFVVYLIIFDYYSKGHRIVVNNFKIAAGVFEEDKYLALIRGIVNLIISIVMVMRIGIAGIFVGTVVSGLIPSLIKPVIIYQKIFKRSARFYFNDSLQYFAVLMIPLLLLELIKRFLLIQLSGINFIILLVMVTVIPNLVFAIAFSRSSEFNYLLDIVKSKISKRGTL